MDEYGGGGEGTEFHWPSIFKSMGSFVGIFLGSFIVGCAVGLLTALVSCSCDSHVTVVCASCDPLLWASADEVLKAQGLPLAGDGHVCHHVLQLLSLCRVCSVNW